MGDGAGYIQSDELAVFWTRGAELTARMGLLMHQLQRERGLMTLHVADASWGAQCSAPDHTRTMIVQISLWQSSMQCPQQRGTRQ